jgi:hypothetical protein
MGRVTSVTSFSNSIAFITPDRNFSDEPTIRIITGNIGVVGGKSPSFNQRGQLRRDFASLLNGS